MPGRRIAISLPAALTLLLITACTRSASPPSTVAPAVSVNPPELLVLGTAQDGGLPHAACRCVQCRAARRDPGRRRLVASLALLPAPPGGVWLIDLTPDLRPQLDLLPLPADEAALTGVDRRPINGALLTHAHLGHYTGLGFLGYEAIDTSGIPVRCSSSMARYLEANAPWSQLVERRNIVLDPHALDGALELAGDVRVTAFAVPHRDELSDTLAYLVEGPRRRVLYVPDTDGWDRWDPPVERRLAEVDLALVDGTFYSTDELPGRDVRAIGHPTIVESMDRFQPLVDDGRLEIAFTHLNHSNPALDPDGPARAEIERRGFRILGDGERLPL